MTLICCRPERPTNNPRVKQRWSGKYMPTVQTITVKAGGLGDYSSLSAAEAGEQTNLVTADVQLDIECYAFEDTSAVDFDGWTTDATRYIRIFTPTAERHDGKWDTSKYRLAVNAGFWYAFIAREDYTRVEGLQVHNTNTAFDANVIGLWGVECLLDASVIRASSTASGTAVVHGGADQTTVRVRNAVVMGTNATIGIACGFGRDLVVDNCTVVNFGTGISTSLPTDANVVRNCYVQATTPYSGTMTRTTCAHSTAGVFAGSTAGVAYDTSNFVSVTGGSEDLHLVDGSALIGAGTDLSGTFTTDIDGDVRSAWDVGADEFEGGGGGEFNRRRRLIMAAGS
jgi:hypothetical protein